MLNMSPRQAQRFLLSHYGKSFTQKRMDAQMAVAAELLRSSRLSITEIGEKNGLFVRRTLLDGVSPLLPLFAVRVSAAGDGVI